MEMLRKVGLSEYESKIYEAILKNGRSDAQRISEFSGVPKTAVYPNLRTLIKKGLVQEMKGDISLFEALPHSGAINNYIDSKIRDLSSLKRELLLELSDIKVNKVENKEVLWITHGKEASREFYKSAFERARKTIFILGWRFEKVSDKYIFLNYLKKLLKKKIDVRILVTGDKVNKALVKDYQESGIKVRYISIKNLSIFIADSKECKITLKNERLGEKLSINVIDENLARAMNSYFLSCWEKAEEI